MDKEFQEWMDEQMSKYRDESVPFIGYVWYERGGTFGGGALYRLDTVEVKESRPTFQNVKLGNGDGEIAIKGIKLRVNKAGLNAVKRLIRKLESEGKQVYTYLG
jgi:hypothetical protein